MYYVCCWASQVSIIIQVATFYMLNFWPLIFFSFKYKLIPWKCYCQKTKKKWFRNKAVKRKNSEDWKLLEKNNSVVVVVRVNIYIWKVSKQQITLTGDE